MTFNNAQIYSRRGKRGSGGWWLAGVVVLVILLAIFLRGPLSAAWWQLVTPLMQWRFASANPSLETSAEYAALAAENKDLKARLGRPEVEGMRVLAGVLSRPPATPYDTLVVDAGSAEGVAEGALVSAGGTRILGTVAQVYTHTARVTLFSAPGQKYQALLTTAHGTLPLELEGQGGGSLRAQVPAATIATVGDQAVLPGIAGGLVAEVVGVGAGESDSFVALYFQEPANVFELRYVEIIKP